MTERQLQFRVGLFVIACFAVVATMIFQFGELRTLLTPVYTVAIHFETAAGIHRSSPVRMNGIRIGRVTEVVLDAREGGVLVVADINEEFEIPLDSRPRQSRSLLGDTAIDIVPGIRPEVLATGDRINGETSHDPMEMVARMESQLNETIDAFVLTSHEWQQLAVSLNGVISENQSDLSLVMKRSVDSLEKFSATMDLAGAAVEGAGRILNNPETARRLEETLSAMPRLVDETRLTVRAVHSTVRSISDTMNQLRDITAPLAQNSESFAKQLHGTLGNLEHLSGQLSVVAELAADEDGSLNRFLTDPDLYRNLNQSAASLAVLLRNMEPVVEDLRIFSDKVARHPELIGVSGALRSSSGIKNPPEMTDVERPSRATLAPRSVKPR